MPNSKKKFKNLRERQTVYVNKNLSYKGVALSFFVPEKVANIAERTFTTSKGGTYYKDSGRKLYSATEFAFNLGDNFEGIEVTNQNEEYVMAVTTLAAIKSIHLFGKELHEHVFDLENLRPLDIVMQYESLKELVSKIIGAEIVDNFEELKAKK